MRDIVNRNKKFMQEKYSSIDLHMPGERSSGETQEHSSGETTYQMTPGMSALGYGIGRESIMGREISGTVMREENL